jgi:hypothetical protein
MSSFFIFFSRVSGTTNEGLTFMGPGNFMERLLKAFEMDSSGV